MPMVYQMNKINLKKPSCYSHKSEKTYCMLLFYMLHAVNLKSIWSVYCEVSQLKNLNFKFVYQLI